MATEQNSLLSSNPKLSLLTLKQNCKEKTSEHQKRKSFRLMESVSYSGSHSIYWKPFALSFYLLEVIPFSGSHLT